MRRLTFLIATLYCLSNITAADWYVAPTAAGTGSGNSCSNAAAATSLQTIINNATAGDIVNLTGGEFVLSSAVAINKALTIQGAGMGATVITTNASQLSPFSITSNNVVVRDLTISKFPGSSGLNKGFYIYGKTGIQLSSIEFKDFPAGQVSEIIIVDNQLGALGVSIDGCWFHSSSGTNAITIRRNNNNNIDVTIQNTVFADLGNSGLPAGIYYNQISGTAGGTFNVTVDNCIFSCLTTSGRGAAIGLNGATSSFIPTFLIKNSSFVGNTNTSSSEGGGAVYMANRANATFENCLFEDNTSASHGGGAIYADGLSPSAIDLLVKDCIFDGNSGQEAGAVHLRKPGTASLTTDFENCLFVNNTSSGGPGGIGTESSIYAVNISNSTFAANDGTSTTSEALEADTGGTVTINNSIVWGNPTNGTANKELLRTSGTANINNSVYVAANLSGTWGGTGNSGTDPMLDASYIPTSGTPAGYRTPTGGVGGSPGDFDTTVGSCASRGFTYPTPNPFCIEPIEDSGTITTAGGTVIADITNNDKINGQIVVLGTSGNAVIAEFGSWPSGISLNTNTAAVDVSSGLTVGIYEVEYSLCDKVTPPSCVTNTITITIESALPVELLNFHLRPHPATVSLHWETAWELNNEGFEIHKSGNGRSWEYVGFVPGQGTSNERSLYRFEDSSPFPGLNYYRLKQLDVDGQFAWSPIQIIERGVAAGATPSLLYPNPIKDHLYIRREVSAPPPQQIIISDLNGRMLIQEKPGAFTTDLSIINLGHLQPACYVLRLISASGEVESVRFIKQ